jgi:folate-binding protein YgfZ
MKRLRLYKLRANADLLDETNNYSVLALWGDGIRKAMGLDKMSLGSAKEQSGGVKMMDPRLEAAGARVVFPKNSTDFEIKLIGAGPANSSDYDRHRLKLGLPNGSRDLVIDKAILIESGFDELNGIDWNKGCYMGQELTARTKYRGLVKKRLVSVTIEGAKPEPGTPIMVGDKNVGEMRSSNGNNGIALLRLDQLENEAAIYLCDQTVLSPRKPEWAIF